MIFEILEFIMMLPALAVFATREYDFWHSFWIGYAILQVIGIWHISSLLGLVKLLIIAELYFLGFNKVVYRAMLYVKKRIEMIEKKYAIVETVQQTLLRLHSFKDS